MKCEEKEIVHHWNTESVLSLCSLRSSQRKKVQISAKSVTLTFLFIYFFYELYIYHKDFITNHWGILQL